MTFRNISTRRRAVAAVTVAAALTLSACGGGDNSTSTAPADDGAASAATDQGSTSGSSATVSVDGRGFTFDLPTCVVSGEEVVAHGPGSEAGSAEPAYLEADLTSATDGEVRVTLGADSQFSSSDDFYLLSSYAGGGFAATLSGSGFEVDGEARDSSGDGSGYPMSVQLACD